MNLLSAVKSVRLFSKKEKLIPLTTIWGETLDSEHVLEEYPRPQLVRGNYTILNGYWDYVIVPKDTVPTKYDGKILVPFSPEAPLSGVGRQLKPDELLICTRDLPASAPSGDSRRCILHFGAVDQFARIFVNNTLVDSHVGGYLPFSIDITKFLKESKNILTVYIEDHSDTSYHSVGKQKLKRGGMFYTAQSGMWQTVWLEWVPETYITDLQITPNYDKETVQVSVMLNHPLSASSNCDTVYCRVLDADGNIVSKSRCANHSDSLCNYSCYCDIDSMVPWTPDNPYLYSLEVCACEDNVLGYFGMRTFTIEPDKFGIARFCLNHQPLFLKGILDQGYWPDGLYTPPSDEAFIFDIQKMKSLGFNMLRKHAKLEPARWYYHCDRLGMIVWQDMVNGGGYRAPFMTWLPALFPALKVHFSDRLHSLLCRKNPHGREEFIQECKDTVSALRCFPCISTWVIFNEGWGQFDSRKITKLFHELDPDRLVDSASGWFDRKCGDFKSEHNYFNKQTVIPDKRAYVLSEYGGYACQIKDHFSIRTIYGYRIYRDIADFQNAYCHLQHDEIQPLIEQGLCGAVYTQVSDIEEEVNGLLTYDRKICKLDILKIAPPDKSPHA